MTKAQLRDAFWREIVLCNPEMASIETPVPPPAKK
jgi:hypothetical protein